MKTRRCTPPSIREWQPALDQTPTHWQRRTTLLGETLLRYGRAIAVLGPVLLIPSALSAASFPDAVTDEPLFLEHNITSCEAEVAGGALKVTVRYAAALPLLSENWGVIFIDTDLNPDTPSALANSGADCIVHYNFNRDFGNGFVAIGDQVFDLGQRGTALQSGLDFMTVTLPLSLWGGQSAVRLFVTSNRLPGLEGYDRVPDMGYWDLTSNLAVIPRPGNPLARTFWADPIGDSGFPDLTRLDTVVSNGYFMIWLTFAHSLEDADLHTENISFTVTLKMDLDHRLWSGFTHANDEPRTLGVDAEVQVGIMPGSSSATLELERLKPRASIQGLEPELEDVALGIPDTDSHLITGHNDQFGVASNQLFLSFPLACLRYDDCEMLMTVFASLKATPDGHSDSLPDVGALDTSVGLPAAARIHAAASCVGPETVVPDDPSDSLGESDEGEELVSTRACALDDGGLNITAEVEFLEHISFGFVHLFVDTDDSALTGLPVETGGGPPLGADLYLQLNQAYATFPWGGNPVVAILSDSRDPPASATVSDIGRLVTTRWGGTIGGGQAGGNYSVNFPPELLQSTPGSTVRYALKCLANQNPIAPLPEKVLDLLPDIGVVSVAAPARVPLRVIGLTPHEGPPAGGTRVTLAGNSLPPNCTVRFGGTVVSPANITWGSSGELNVIAPPHALGSVPVTVEEPGGVSFTRANGFQYITPEVVGPTLMNITPNLGPIPGGTEIQLSGLNFLPGAVVRIGGTPATGVTVQSPFSITATVPPGQIGPADVVVTNPDGKRIASIGGYNYGCLPPVVWTAFPNYGPLAGGTAVTIAGEGFASGATASIGGVPLTGITVVSDRMITGTTGPGNSAGLCEVRVTNPDTVQGWLDDAFTYGGADPGKPPPYFIPVSVIPLSSPPAGGIEVSIIGHDFQPGVAVLFNGYPARIRYTDSLGGTIKLTMPSHAPGSVEVRVVNPDGQTCILAPGDPMFSFVYETDEPAIGLGGVNPLSGPTEGGQEVDIWGERFRPGVRVEFGGVPAQLISATNYLLTTLTPPHAPGPVVVRVINPAGLSCTYEGDWVFSPYTFTGSAPGAPIVQQVDPPQGSFGGGETVTLHGQNFFAGIRVFFGTRECTNVVRTSSQVLTLTTSPSRLGAVDVRVQNADEQTGLLPVGFTYVPPLPVIAGLSASAGPVAGGTTVMLSGSGFMSESEVLVGGNRVLSVNFLSATNLSFTTPPGFPGSADVAVVNSENRIGMLTAGFTYQGDEAPAPVVSAVLPAIVEPAGGTTVVIHGRNFLAGLSVTIGGQPLGDLQIQSSITVIGLAPPHAAGAYDLVVSNADGQSVTWPDAISYFPSNAPPVITLQPQSLVVSSGSNAVFRVTASGVPPLSFQWHFNGSLIPDATAAMLSLAGVKLSQAGNYSVVVMNSYGSVTSQVAVLSVTGPPTRPTMRIMRESSSQLRLRVEDEDVAPLALQCSTNLVDWMAVGEVPANAWRPLDMIYPAWTNYSPTFFRAARTSPTDAPPTITSPPQSQTIFVGENASFGVTATGTPPLSYQWRRNGADLSNGPNVAGATGPLLTLSHVQTNDAGTFVVVVTNAAGSITSAPVTLTVQVPAVPPSIGAQPQSQTVPVGSNVSFSVTATGTPPLHYRWSHDDILLNSGGRIAGADSATLTLSAVELNDAGTYRVGVSNEIGGLLSQGATLDVTPAPLTLATALNGTNLVWTTGGAAPWMPQTDTTQDGEDAVASGRIDDAQSTWVETTVIGPGTLIFWWRVSSEYDYDFFQFLYEGYLQEEISGEEGWQQSGWTIPAGTHTLRWQYTKDDSVSGGEDRAWLDQVTFTPTIGASYTVESTEGLNMPHWLPHNTMIGNGSVVPSLIPMTNHTPRFFRTRQP